MLANNMAKEDLKSLLLRLRSKDAALTAWYRERGSWCLTLFKVVGKRGFDVWLAAAGIYLRLTALCRYQCNTVTHLLVSRREITINFPLCCCFS